jgi:hypothetical protein
MTTLRKPTRHVFAGEAEACALVNWLNGRGPEGKKQPAVRKHIAKLIENMNANSDALIKNGAADPTLTDRIDRGFARYPLRIETVQVQDTGRYKSFPEPRWFFRWSCREGEYVANLLFVIIRLAERGLLRRVRPCLRCTRLFFARFNHQRFCKTKCQVLHYQTGEYWKQHRRERYQNR